MVQMTKPVCHICGPLTRAIPRKRKMIPSLVALNTILIFYFSKRGSFLFYSYYAFVGAFYFGVKRFLHKLCLSIEKSVIKCSHFTCLLYR